MRQIGLRRANKDQYPISRDTASAIATTMHQLAKAQATMMSNRRKSGTPKSCAGDAPVGPLAVGLYTVSAPVNLTQAKHLYTI
jgi:hypothetical protein